MTDHSVRLAQDHFTKSSIATTFGRKVFRMHGINIMLHVSVGTLALLAGLLPYFTAKGGGRHKYFGRVYLVLMIITLVTAFIGVVFFRSRPFLVVVTVLATYSTLSGQRALRYREKGPRKLDLYIAIATASVGIAFLSSTRENVLWDTRVVTYLLSFMFLYCLYDVLRFLKFIRGRRLWIWEHALKMSSSYAALFSAAVGTVLTGWEPWNQITPALLSSILYLYVIIWLGRSNPISSK